MKRVLYFSFLIIGFCALYSFKAAVSGEELFDLLGLKMEHEKVTSFLEPLGSYEKENGVPKYPHYMYFDAGVELVVNVETNTVHAIFLMSSDAKWYKAYSGELPYGLGWSSTRADVERILGEGKRRAFGSEVDMHYKSHNLEIQYNTTDDSDMGATINHIQVRTY